VATVCTPYRRRGATVYGHRLRSTLEEEDDGVKATTREHIPWFIAWAGVGAGYAFRILAALTIGVFVLAMAAVATAALARRPQARAGLTGLLSGLGLPLLYVAFLNRAGPGLVCTTTVTSQTCGEEWSPWPWLLIGTGLVAGGCLWFGRRSA
jgi:hypothetical protein